MGFQLRFKEKRMAIKVGDTIPKVDVMLATAEGPQKSNTHDIMGKGKVALFSVPGAFTPTCSARHLPGFVDKAGEFKKKGVDRIVCMAVNDAFVMKAWGQAQNAVGAVDMLADGNGDFTRALGLGFDGKGFGMGERSQRFAAVIEDGVVKQLFVEAPGAFEVSSAEYMLSKL
jgi:peroxiredoxin